MKKKPDCKALSLGNKFANVVSEKLDADVLLINSGIGRGLDNQLILDVAKRKKRKNVLLILVTEGGDPDVAYRIARCLQDHYEKFIAFVTGYCKSAGTLCMLGANEIIMSDIGELGPLDIQVEKKDDLFESSSGLVATEALRVLQEKAFKMFEDCMLAIKIGGAGQITFKTASEIAVKSSIGLMEPLYRQIDPLQLGEAARSMKIASAYGWRLMVRSENFTEKTLELLSETYPSHSFVIDKAEADYLFINVRKPSSDEENLVSALEEFVYEPLKGTCMVFLSDERKENTNGKGSKNGIQGRAKESKRGEDSGRSGKDS